MDFTQQIAEDRIDEKIDDAIDRHVKQYHKRNGRFVPPTAKQAQAYGDKIGFIGFDGQYFVDSNTATGWVVGKTLKPMKSWEAVIRTWMRNEEQSGAVHKTRLLPIPGKHCCKCRMPAVYKSGGDFDFYYCASHMPAEVKEKYCG